MTCDTCEHYDHEAHNCPVFCEVIESLKEQDSCKTCLRQACPHRDGMVRINCPLWKGSAI